jgi:hypothetical protein
MTKEDTVQGSEKLDTAAIAEPNKVELETDEALAADEGKAQAKPETEEEKAKAATDAAKVLQKHKQSASERVQQAVTRQREAERRAERFEREAIELRAKLKAPDPNQYDDNAKYTADLLAHQLDEREVSRSEKLSKEATDEKLDAVKEAWQTRVADFKTEIPDFDDVVYSDKVQMSRDTGVIIGEMEDGPQVAYFLAKNAAEARRIDRLPERAKIIELGKLAGKLSAPVPRKVTSAPAPINAVGGNQPARTDSLNSMSMADYGKFVAKEMARR